MIIIKSDAEIAVMKRNGKILIDIFSRLEEFIKPGITTKDVDNVVENIITSQFAVASSKNYGYPIPFPASCCISVNAELVHGIPSDKTVLKEGDIVSVDIVVFKDGFHVDASRTFPVGKISPEAKRLIDVTKDSFFKGVEKAVVGGRLFDISAAIQREVEGAGFSVIRDMFGHGIGRSMHEDPGIPNFGVSGQGKKLKAGMVLAIEPMVSMGDYRILTQGDGWTTVTVDGSLTAHYENTVAITKDGPQILTM